MRRAGRSSRRCRTGMAAAFLLLGAFGRSASADQIVLPSPVLERGHPVTAIYRMKTPGTGKGVLRVAWTDICGRLVERRDVEFRLDRGTDVTFSLDLRRAVAIGNELHAHLVFDGLTDSGAAAHRESRAETSFSAIPPAQPWSDYQIIMWQGQNAQQYTALKGLGITAGMVHANRLDPGKLVMSEVEPLLAGDLKWYVENIATDFYSSYHRWFPDRPVNWRFLEVQRLYREDPLDRAAFLRDPSLSDPTWLKRIQERLSETVRIHRPYQPLFYNLADEAGIADLAAFWDFDLSDASLKSMRGWLQERYGSLAALNSEWGTDFAVWDQVVPQTTAEAMRRSDDNFSSWADFKTWMDVAFARALQLGTASIHAADPGALAAIEGGQIPGWGGYDYSLLANGVDVMELYDFGGNVDIVRSLNPKTILLTTSSESGSAETHRVWRELLRGTRGLILWDERHEFAGPDGNIGIRGRDSASMFRELGDGIGALLINSRVESDPIAILYSPASMRTQWMLDWRPHGDAWSRRDAAAEYEDNNAPRSAMTGEASIIERAGFRPEFVSPQSIERGVLRAGYRILVLPHAIAMSSAEAGEIRRFVADGGLVVADTEPGLFDEHSRRLTKPALDDVFAGAATPGAPRGTGKAGYLSPELKSREPASILRMRGIIKEHGLEPPLVVRGETGEAVTDVEIYRFRNGAVTLIALQRDLDVASSGRDAVEANTRNLNGEKLVLTLPQSRFAYDLRARKVLGRSDRLALSVGPIEPTLLAFSDAELPTPTIAVSRDIHSGDDVEINFGPGGSADTALHVLHVDVVNPSGEIVAYYSGNLLAPGGVAAKRLPLAFNDPTGSWTIRVTDLLSGQSATAALEVLQER